jgi:cation diffusion facilitator CzcD-associated flavoprotein CzcO
MHSYLKAYAIRSQLLGLIDLGSEVLEISRGEHGQGWLVKVNNGEHLIVEARKLLIATGVTNVPHRPRIQGLEDFGAPVLHSADLGKKSMLVTKAADVKTVAVLGGGKSAYDAVYLAACAGRQVEWIMRESGKGPEWIFPSHTNIGPFKALRERLAARRFISSFSPCLWEDGMGWLRNLLHFTTIGKKIAQGFWSNIHQATINDCGFREDEKTKVLEPEQGYVGTTITLFREC